MQMLQQRERFKFESRYSLTFLNEFNAPKIYCHKIQPDLRYILIVLWFGRLVFRKSCRCTVLLKSDSMLTQFKFLILMLELNS